MTPRAMRRGRSTAGVRRRAGRLDHQTAKFLAASAADPLGPEDNSRPSGESHNSGFKVRRGPPASGSTMSTSFQVLPLSPRVLSTT